MNLLQTYSPYGWIIKLIVQSFYAHLFIRIQCDRLAEWIDFFFFCAKNWLLQVQCHVKDATVLARPTESSKHYNLFICNLPQAISAFAIWISCGISHMTTSDGAFEVMQRATTPLWPLTIHINYHRNLEQFNTNKMPITKSDKIPHTLSASDAVDT